MKKKEREPDEISEAGNPIYKYETLNNDFPQPVEGDSEITDHIDQHLNKFFDSEDIMVFHEIVSSKIHVDIYWVKPNKDRDYHLLLTSGMSSLPMNLPEGYDHLKYAEICTFLPKEWSMDQEDFKDENIYWPIRQLKTLARFPHLYDTWLGLGHTITNGNPPAPMSDNNLFTGSILLSPIILPEKFLTIPSDDKTINVYLMIPLYEEEMNYKLKHGADDLIKQFDKFNVSDIIDIKRPNTCI